MDLLLDTHVFLWWDRADPKLGEAAREAIANPDNNIFVSAASVWEIAIKHRKGKLRFAGSPTAAIAQNGFLGLPVEISEAELAGSLDWNHPDPFDRVIVAQAQTHSLVLVHADAIIAGYKSVSQLWAGRKVQCS
jgi:PIN domain nuclease of toxin-antitoxin system